MTAASLQDRLTALANHAVTAKGGWRDNDAQVMLEAVDALNAIRPRELAIEQAIAHARAEIYHLKALIARGKLRAALEQATKPPERLAAMPGPVPHDREGAYIRGLNDAVAIITAEVRNVVRAVESERSQAAQRPAQEQSE